MARISDKDYNKAREELVRAGSDSARVSHIKHSRSGDSPVGHGNSLILEAIEEFQQRDRGGSALTRGMTIEHFVNVSNAAGTMGIDVEYLFDQPYDGVHSR